jgi:uncharacterized membrane protein YoaK (UPF0700 family)
MKHIYPTLKRQREAIVEAQDRESRENGLFWVAFTLGAIVGAVVVLVVGL